MGASKKSDCSVVVRRRQTIRLADWHSVLDNFLRANEMPVLGGAGSRPHKQAVAVAEAACDTFDETRKLAERAADAAIDELDELKKSPNLPVRRAKNDKTRPLRFGHTGSKWQMLLP